MNAWTIIELGARIAGQPDGDVDIHHWAEKVAKALGLTKEVVMLVINGKDKFKASIGGA
jgi:hypothetical protein